MFAMELIKPHPPPIPKTLPTRQSWKPPCSGLVKINVDAAIRDEMDFIRIGVVVRDEIGTLLGAMARRVFGRFSPFLRECIVVREGAFFAQMGGFDDWTIESDVVNVVRAIQSPVTRVLDSNIISDIRDVLSEIGSGNICYAPRDNGVVNFLAAYAFSSSIDCIWIENLSKFIGPFVLADLA